MNYHFWMLVSARSIYPLSLFVGGALIHVFGLGRMFWTGFTPWETWVHAFMLAVDSAAALLLVTKHRNGPLFGGFCLAMFVVLRLFCMFSGCDTVSVTTVATIALAGAGALLLLHQARVVAARG
jgi:hypothetical protein